MLWQAMDFKLLYLRNYGKRFKISLEWKVSTAIKYAKLTPLKHISATAISGEKYNLKATNISNKTF